MAATDLPDVEFTEDLRLLVWRPRGVLDEALLSKIIALLDDLEGASTDSFNRFIDTTGADAVYLNFKYVFHISLYRRLSYANRPAVKSAILATNEAAIHYGRHHAMLMQGSQINVRVFEEVDAAAAWLAVSEEVLRRK